MTIKIANKIMKNFQDIEKEFTYESHWLICDCDLEEEIDCKMTRIIPTFRKALNKVENIVKKEFINGERCLSCGRKKKNNLSNNCLKCLEQE